MLGTKMASEGLPIIRQERGADRGVLAGADFLKVLLATSSDIPPLPDTTQHSRTSRKFKPTASSKTETPSYIREVRSTSFYKSSLEPDKEDIYNYNPTLSSAQKFDSERTKPSDQFPSEGVIVAVRVSSSVGKTLIHKSNQNSLTDKAISSNLLETTTELTNQLDDSKSMIFEEHPSIIAEANKSEFSVEEKEPITSNSDLAPEYTDSYPASVHALPRPQNVPSFNPSPDYVTQEITNIESKEKTPFHQTLIYHDNREQDGAPSVSFSTVIQNVAHPAEKQWEEKLVPHERQERNYDSSQADYLNDFHQRSDNRFNVSKNFYPHRSSSQTKNPEIKENNWEKPEKPYIIPSTTSSQTTEKNWEHQAKPYPPRRLPTVYGQPEQNYEVDESVSVVSNGRAHGVQAHQPAKLDARFEQAAKKPDDNQKVGYVVEGRNYRKYRVEERTPDGFIVGEYGVVSHDDGSLRGVRYTADGTINPRVIYDALMKFLSL